MKEHDSYLALRLPASLKAEINKLVESGKFKNLSEIVRQALTEFLTKNKPLDDMLREAFTDTEGIDA
jgi:Arc/MetJ-type ribon-helix-helix transcriptional regulator